MRLTTIGTGTAAPHPQRVQAGTLVEAGGLRVLVDCGSGVLWRMAQLGLDWSSITHVVLTHFHADHTADLVAFLTAWRYGQLPPRAEPVTIIGPAGTAAFVDRIAAAFAPAMAAFVPGLEVLDRPPHDPLVLSGGVTLECCPVPHTPESVAWSLSHEGRRITCSGDLGPSDHFAEWASGSDLLLLECSLPAAFDVPIHLTPEQCAEVAARSRPGALWLNHFYPPVESLDLEGIIGARWSGSVVRATDGASVLLGPGNGPPISG
ncbi:MAG: ribonuclease Z [Gemmatimonadetes bacterium]|nr:ribonuclease Z [Gemmatimonadota bacterium]